MGFKTSASVSTKKLMQLPEGFSHVSQFAPIHLAGAKNLEISNANDVGTIWTDGENIYNSTYFQQHKFNKETKAWEVMNWDGLHPNYGYYVWTDGTHIYSTGSVYDEASGVSRDKPIRLNKDTMKWEVFENGTLSYPPRMWTDGMHVYSSSDQGNQMVMDNSTGEWSYTEWKGELGFLFGDSSTHLPFNLGEEVYFVYDGVIFSLTEMDGGVRWRYSYPSSWRNGDIIPSADGECVWEFNGAYYYSSGSVQARYDTTSACWKKCTWNGLTNFYGNRVWTDGVNCYYSYGSEQYVLDLSTSTWISKSWAGLTNIDINGAFVWRHNGRTYYSDGIYQYVLASDSSTWEAMTWSGMTAPNRSNMWAHESTWYYSNGNTHYALVSTEWRQKAWSVSTSFKPKNIIKWHNNTYLMTPYGSYIFDSSAEDWTPIMVSGVHAFEGTHIWEEKGNIYHWQNGRQAYVLNVETKTWSKVSSDRWQPISKSHAFSAGKVWKMGDTYYFDYAFYLDNSDDTWKPLTWRGANVYWSGNLWTDGEHVYLTYKGSGYNDTYQNLILIEDSCDRYVKQHGKLVKDYAGVNGRLGITADGVYDITEYREVVVNVTPITFTLGGTAKFANSGMTWGEWLDTVFNDVWYARSIVVNGVTYTALCCYVESGHYTVIADANGNIVQTTDTIISGHAYQAIDVTADS